MALFIVGSYKASPYDPDSAFDPVTHVATEASFIQLLEHGVYDSKYIGYFVTLSNTYDYNGGKWVIADVNHDSTNTGQSNCYDLIAVDGCVCRTFATASNHWRNSIPRSVLNSSFYSKFSTDIKSHIMNIKYDSEGTWYDDDKVILPSYKEVGGTSTSHYSEGVKYSIFTDNNSRIKYKFGTTTTCSWWTRTHDKQSGNTIDIVTTAGSLNILNQGYTDCWCVPLIRIG